MRNIKDQLGGFAAIFLSVFVCFYAQSARADDEVAGSSSEDIGTGTFSPFPFKVSVSVRGGYDDNITTSKNNKQDSAFTNAAIELTYDFGSPRTQLSLQGGVGYTYYWDQPSGIGFGADQDYDINVNVGFTLEHKASPRLTINATGYATFQTEPDFSIATGVNRRSGNYFFTQDKFSLTYLWAPRFATTTSYTFIAVNYEDDAVGRFEDRFENLFGNEFKFLLSPQTSLVAEYRFGIVSYVHEGDVIQNAIFLGPFLVSPARHLDRDSISHYVLGGFDHSFNERLTASFRGGAEFRDYVDAESGFDDNQVSPYFEATVNYALGKNTSVSWTNRYAIEDGGPIVNPTRRTFRTGLAARHNFTPKLSATFGAYYELDDYDSFRIAPSFVEESFDLALGLRYAITRYIGVSAGYNHTEVWNDRSAFLFREYTRNRYWAGINVVF